MLKKLKLGQKFTLSLILISIVPLAIISFSNYYYLKAELQTKAMSDLRAVNNSRASHINHLIQLRQEQAKQLAGTFTFRQLKETGANDPELLSSIQKHIESIQGEIQREPSSAYVNIDQKSAIVNISVWDITGMIVANTNKDFIGMRMPFKFLHILYDQGAYFKGFEKDPVTGKIFLTVLEEIRNWETDEYAGVALLKTKATILNNITNAREGLGDNAETYLVNKEHLMITESRFIEDNVLKVKVDTKGVDACFEGRQETSMYEDYRGHSVFGAQTYLSDQQWCLLTEIDVNETFKPVMVFRKRMIAIFICLILFILLFVFLANRIFVRPVIKLHNASLHVAKGNYDIKLEAHGQDELSDLSRAFTQMSNTLSFTTSELKQKNIKLQEQREELKKFSERKSEFVSMVSHELRTPMTIIKESLSQVLDETHPENEEDKKKLLSMALNHIARLGNLINNLLDLSKIEAGKAVLNKRIENIVSVAKEACDNFSSQAKKKNIGIQCNCSSEKIVFSFDHEKIVQVFINLIGNSMKFVEKGSIEVDVTEKIDHIVCSVKDTGKGISKEDLNKIFGKFQQLGNRPKTPIKGTGLGLSISKALVELHGGKIWVESTLDVGTTFSFTIPKEQGTPSDSIETT